MIQKKALEVDPKVVSRLALGGLVTGGSTAALLNLVHMVRAQADKRKAMLATPEQEEDTIVLTLPNKRAAVKDKKDDPTSITKVTKSRTVIACGPKKGKQARRAFDGTFGIKTSAGWPTLTAGTLAALGGTAAGAALVNKAYQMRRESMLDEELETARKEYMDLLAVPKQASNVFDELFDVIGAEKTADNSAFGMLNYPLAAAALLGILGTGGTAYITKRILDEKAKELQGQGKDIPTLKRIVFRTEPAAGMAGKEAEAGTQADIECIQAALAITMDKMGASRPVLEDEAVSKELTKLGQTSDDMLKLAQDADALLAHLQGNEKLRRMIQRAAMERHPVMKHFRGAVGLPGIRGLADKKLMDRATQILKPAAPTPPPGSVKLSKPTNFGGNYNPDGFRIGFRGKGLDAEKQGIGLSTALMTDITGSVVGSSVVGKKQTELLAKALAEAQEKQRAEKVEQTPESRAQGVALEGLDPKAKLFLEQNRERILKILQQLAVQKTI